MRTVPSVSHQDVLTEYDHNVRHAFIRLTGLDLTQTQWDQATQGLSFAGLGLRSTARHCNAAFAASLSQANRACCELDPAFVWEGILPGTALFHALSAFNFELHEDHRLPLAEPSGKRQQELSQHLDEADHKAFFDSLCLDDRATVLSEMLTGASDFLEAVPCGDKVMANEEIACELRTRLCVRQYVDDSWCPLCDSVLDAKGRHAHVCAGR